MAASIPGDGGATITVMPEVPGEGGAAATAAAGAAPEGDDDDDAVETGPLKDAASMEGSCERTDWKYR